MKRLLVVLMIFGLSIPGYCADQWTKGQLAGTISVSDSDTYNQVNNNALDRLLYDYRHNAVLVYASASTLTVTAGRIAIPNAAGTVVRWRGETSSTTATWSNIDTGSEANSTQYYVYLSGDTDETGFDVVISTSSSAPSGITYYRKIGYFYNNSSGNIVNVGNIKGGGVPNIMKVTGTTDITSTSSSYEDMTDMEIRFVSSGYPVKVTFAAPMTSGGALHNGQMVIDIDGTDKVTSFIHASSDADDACMQWLEDLSAGTHTIKVQWKYVAGGTVSQNGATMGARVLITEEL